MFPEDGIVTLAVAGREGKRERDRGRAAVVLLEAVSHRKDPSGDVDEKVSELLC